MVWLIPGFILCLTSMIYGAVRPTAFAVIGLSFLWLMWEVANYE